MKQIELQLELLDAFLELSMVRRLTFSGYWGKLTPEVRRFQTSLSGASNDIKKRLP